MRAQELIGSYSRKIRVESWQTRTGFARATNCLLLLEHEGGVRFGVETYGLNQHGCVLAGRVLEDSGQLWRDAGADCRIELAVTEDSIALKRDVPEFCSGEACGASVSAVGATFLRTRKAPVPAQRGELCGALHDTLH